MRALAAVAAANQVLDSPETIAKFFASLSRLVERQHLGLKSDYTWVNERPGLLLAKQTPKGDFELETVFSFEFQKGKIGRIFAMRNPDKLKIFRQQA